MKKLLSTLLPLLFLTAAAYGGTTASLEGKIIEVCGQTPPAIEVIARNESTGEEQKIVSNEKGEFVFRRLEPGHYWISAQVPQLEPILVKAEVKQDSVTNIKLYTSPLVATGNIAVDTFIASSKAQGGNFPAGNISFLNVNDSVDLYFLYSYFSILALISIYGIYRYRLIYLFLRYRKCQPSPKARFAEGQLPKVTVQLPLYNEKYVAERLIDAVARLDYPKELLEIQVLDDSTDETQEVACRIVENYRREGFKISYHHRDDRTGYKAGALEAGLKEASGEFILIFDADFQPRPDCIRRMVDYFTDERIGMVQMRWGHINRDYSLLTKVQAIMIDGHFIVEQCARSRAGGFFNFNGTAGMWRRKAIQWSGGWQHDTLAEDTDLSYRAQLMGWRFVYLMDEDVPAELPVEMNAFKAQQRRWAKGVVQVGMKLMGRILRDPRLPLRVKLEQFFRLTGNLTAPLVIALALLNLPVLIVRYNQQLLQLFLLDVPILAFSTVSILAYFLVTQWHLYPKTWLKTLKYMPFVLSMGIALSFSNARAAIEAVLGIKTPFERTPKYKVEKRSDRNWIKKSYAPRRFTVPWLELFFATYFGFTIWYAVYTDVKGTLPFLFIYMSGYTYAATMSIVQTRISMRRMNEKRE